MCQISSESKPSISGRSLAFAIVAGLGMLSAPAFADEQTPNLLTDSFNVSLGSFIVDTDTTMRLDGRAGEIGTPVDWERTFGEGDVTRFRLDGYWRFADRHKVRALIFSSSRDNARTIEDEIEWQGETFPVDARIKAEFGFDIYELAYEYAFMRRDNFELGASAGLHYTDISASLSATVDTGSGSQSGSVRSEASVGAPLPVFGLRGTWALPYNLWIDVSGQYFTLSIDEYDGNLQDYRATLTWQPKKWLGIGVGYDAFSVDVDVDASNFRGTLDFDYSGPLIFYSASF